MEVLIAEKPLTNVEKEVAQQNEDLFQVCVTVRILLLVLVGRQYWEEEEYGDHSCQAAKHQE